MTSKYAALHIILADGENRTLDVNYGKISAPAAVVLNGITTEERVEDPTVRGLLDVSQKLETGKKNGGALHYYFAFGAPSDEREASTLETVIPAHQARAAIDALRQVPGVFRVENVTPARPKRSRTTTEEPTVSKGARNRAVTLGFGTV